MNDPSLLECIINYIRNTRTVFRPCLRYLISSWTHCVVFAIGARPSEIAGDVAGHGAILGANSINGALWLDSCCIILFGTMHEANTRAGELRSFLTNGINRAGLGDLPTVGSSRTDIHPFSWSWLGLDPLVELRILQWEWPKRLWEFTCIMGVEQRTRCYVHDD